MFPSPVNQTYSSRNPSGFHNPIPHGIKTKADISATFNPTNTNTLFISFSFLGFVIPPRLTLPPLLALLADLNRLLALPAFLCAAD